MQSAYLGTGCEFIIEYDNEKKKYVMQVTCGKSVPKFKTSESEGLTLTELQDLKEEDQQQKILQILNFYDKGSHTIRNNGELVNGR